MAGLGPAPKDPSKRARRNPDPIPSRTLRFVHGEQPKLPAGTTWPKRTRTWWAMWGASAQADLFADCDWDYLIDTALIHAAVWSGDLDRMPELRLRVAKFGATPEDRARLRMHFADADKADDSRTERPSASEVYGDLRVLSVGQSKGA
jgi:hypothetical protein